MIWDVLLAIAVVVLLIFWRRPSAVWGAATFAMISGLSIAIFQPGIDWWIVGKAVIIGTFMGLVLEGFPMLVKQRPATRSAMEWQRRPNGGDEDKIGFGRDVYRRNPTSRSSSPDRTQSAEPDDILTEEIRRLLDRIS